MKEIIEKLREFKTIQEANIEKGESIIDIIYYGEISLSKNDIDMSNERKEDLYLVKKEKNGKTEFEFRTNSGVIARIGDEGQIVINEDFKGLISEKEFLFKMPISLEKLEELERNKSNQRTAKTAKADKTAENEQTLEDEKTIEKEDKDAPRKYIENPKDAKIDLRKKITEKENFYDLVPEAKEKGIVDLVVRRKDNSTFEFIGINGDGEEVKLKSLEQTEGTNPNKDIVEINADGSTVKKDQVNTILKIKNGENEGKQNEGFTIKLGEYGIPEVSYYRRSSELNEYSSIPVNMESTNQKRTDRDVREYMEKTRNTTTNDNIKRAEDKINNNYDNETELENIDDDPYNDKIIDSSEIEIRKAALRCKISVEEFKKELEKQEGDTLEEKIENAEEEINEEFRGRSERYI